jgi:hypothetical protein
LLDGHRVERRRTLARGACCHEPTRRPAAHRRRGYRYHHLFRDMLLLVRAE